MGRSGRRRAGLSVRVQLTLSYAIFVVVVGIAFFVVGFLVLRFIPGGYLQLEDGGYVPGRSDLLKVYVKYTVWALSALSVLGLGGGWILAGRMLKPLTRITATARLVRDGSLDHRIHMPGRKNELADLADLFDEMLDRQQAAFEVQERFAANASHELRTPLAVTATLLEVALRNPHGQDYPALLERLQITNNRAVALTESLLRLADANEVGAVAQPVALDSIVVTAIEENAIEAVEHNVAITAQLEAVTVIADVALLHQLVVNLVQNAIRHSGNPGSAIFTTSSDRRRQVATLRVETSGSAVDADTVSRLAEPFLRGTGRIATGQKGHGLGLALVQRIAEVHGGSLHIAPRGGGGVIVMVELPAVNH